MAVTINGSTGISGIDGTAATPSMQGADTNTGMFFPAVDTIAFAEGGVESMRIDSSGYMQGTVNGLGAGRIPAMQYYRLNSALGGANNTSAQNILGVGVTLVGSTQYDFEAVYHLVKTAGTTSHTIGLGYKADGLNGACTINNILWGGVTFDGATVLPLRTTAGGWVGSNSVSNQLITAANTSAAITAFISIKGTVSVNAGGTFTPQYTLTFTPGSVGPYSTGAGSYFRIWPVAASGSNVNIGTWA